MDFMDAFPSDYVTAHDLGDKDVELTIERVELHEFVGEQGKKSDKLHIHYKGAQKPMICNKTNAVLIASFYGKETDGWCGKKVTLYATTCRGVKGGTVDCIRVRGNTKVGM